MFIENKCWQFWQFLLYLHTVVNKLLDNVCQRIKTCKRSRQNPLCLLDSSCMHFYDQCMILQISFFLLAQSSGLKLFNLVQYWGIHFKIFINAFKWSIKPSQYIFYCATWKIVRKNIDNAFVSESCNTEWIWHHLRATAAEEGRLIFLVCDTPR